MLCALPYLVGLSASISLFVLDKKNPLQSLTQKAVHMQNHKEINREQFMQFFRDDEKLNELTPDDRIEIFKTILVGSSDFTKELIEDVMSDYSVPNLKVININNDAK